MVVLASLGDPQLATLLQQGAVGVIPTDTIYGLVTPAAMPKSVEHLYALKHREHKPGTLIAANTEQLETLGLDPAVISQVARLWPNPVSVVLPSPHQLGYLTQDVDGLAVRIPADEALQAVLAQTGPLITSSANDPGQTPAGDVPEAQRYFGEQVDFYVDGGDLRDRPASTLLRLETDGSFSVLRQGKLTVSKEGVVS